MNWKKRINKSLDDVKSIFRALKYRNYRLFFAGQGVSLIGTWMQNIALGWLVYRMTHSAFLLGLISFLNLIPTFFISPFGGVLADRFDRKKLLIFTQILSMVQALLLAVLVLTGFAHIWNIAILSFFLGVVNSVDAPVRQSFVIDLVDDKKYLSNAIALNSAMFNAARLIGPSIAGIVIALVGEGLCFLFNGLSYVAVILALFAMVVKPRKIHRVEKHVLTHLKDGFVYAIRFVPIRYLILIMALVSLMGYSFTVLMPVVAKEILHGGPHTLGFLMGSMGIGALIGALYLASRKTILGLTRIIPVTVCILGAGLIAFSFSHIFILSILLLLFMGFSMILFMGSCNTIIQTTVEEDKRGRVMSLYTLAFMGVSPFGSLLMGALSGNVGVSFSLLFGGISCLAGGFIFALRLPVIRKAIRPVYERMGVLPKQVNPNPPQ